MCKASRVPISVSHSSLTNSTNVIDDDFVHDWRHFYACRLTKSFVDCVGAICNGYSRIPILVPDSSLTNRTNVIDDRFHSRLA